MKEDRQRAQLLDRLSVALLAATGLVCVCYLMLLFWSPFAPLPYPAMIEAEWPIKAEVNRPDSIRVSLIRTEEQTFVPTIEVAGHRALVATSVPVGGTPEAPMEKAFGPEYEACAIASLEESAFDVKPITECRSIDQPRVTWDWILTAKEPGPQFVIIDITLEWRPKQGTGRTIERQIWRSRLDIQVEKPFIATAQLQVVNWFNGLLGLGFIAVPWLFRRIKNKRLGPPFDVGVPDIGVQDVITTSHQVKIETLEKRLAGLLVDYKAASDQLGTALSEVDRARLKRHIETLEQEISEVESELSSLQSPEP